MGSDLTNVLAQHRWDAPPVDVGRLCRDRAARLQAAMADRGVDVAVLLHGANVAYAAGVTPRGDDVTHAAYERPVAVVVAGDDRPHLLSDGHPDSTAGGSGGTGRGHVLDPTAVERHPAVWPDLDEGAEALAGTLAELVGPLAGRTVAVDVQTGAMVRHRVLAGAADVVDAGAVAAAAKLTKTTHELACIAEAQRRNEQAMVATQKAARPRVTRSEVAGVFLSELVGLGVGANLIDPIFQPMPRTLADGPRTTTGGVAFPTGVGNPTFAEGDVVWVDTGVDHLGYASDFGRTWVVGRDPDPGERALFERWCAVMLAVLDVLGPGVTAGDLCRAAEAADASAGDGRSPWLPHFYLAHGVGVESAEMPLVGTDLGRDFDDAFVLAPGMVLVLEPAVWTEGVGGYRAEEVVAVTDDGWCHLGGGHPYQPFAP